MRQVYQHANLHAVLYGGYQEELGLRLLLSFIPLSLMFVFSCMYLPASTPFEGGQRSVTLHLEDLSFFLTRIV